MPPPETAYRFQKALLWRALVGHDQVKVDRYGETLRESTPEEINVRWQERKIESRDARGNVVMLDGLLVVDEEVPIGSLVWLGEEADWYGTGSGGDDAEVMEVVTVRNTPDVKARETRRTLGMMRRGGSSS